MALKGYRNNRILQLFLLFKNLHWIRKKTHITFDIWQNIYHLWSILVATFSRSMEPGIHRYPKMDKCASWAALYEVIEDIITFVLNTKRPLSDIWLLRYKQNSFGCFWEKLKLWFFSADPNSLIPRCGTWISYIFITTSTCITPQLVT